MSASGSVLIMYMSFLALTEEDSGDVTGNIMRGSAIGK